MNANSATFQQIVASVQRMPGLEQVSLGQIMDAVRMAAVDIGNQPWPWNYAETNILVPAPISTGTVSATTGTAAVVGVGTTWGTLASPPGLGDGWRIRFGNSNLDYIVLSFGSATTLTLVQNLNLPANLTAVTYTLYKDTFTYPADYIMGSDVGMYQPTMRTRVQKIPRSKFEAAMNSGLRSFVTNYAMWYCDQGIDRASGKLFRFRLGPPAGGVAELRLCYHSIANTFTTSLLAVSDLPDGFDDIITLVAASKLYDQLSAPGLSQGVKSLAEGKIKLLKRAIATQTIDDSPSMSSGMNDSSVSQWGMSISRMP